MKNLMILSTHSGVGKNLIACGLLRAFAQRGHAVSPFKGLNIEPYTCILPGNDRVSFAQTLQCMAARIEPTSSQSPIIVTYPFPFGSAESGRCDSIYVDGKTDTNIGGPWHERHKRYTRIIGSAIDSLLERYSCLVIEGAGSPVELAVDGQDLPNQMVYSLAQAPCILLVTEMTRGGGYAHLVGTLQLMSPEMRSAVRGVVLNKFSTHSDVSIHDGMAQFEEITGIPVIGSIPFLDRTFIPGEEVDGDVHYVGLPPLEAEFDLLSETLKQHIDVSMIEELLFD